MLASGVFAQGYLMLAGGAGESQGGWSDIPYGWVVEHAANKRIAVISYRGDQTQWLPDYFMSLGAMEARNITIADRFTADAQSTYDTLITYDGIFLRGGDQSIYYERYKDTKTVEALQSVYNKGGVLSGTSAGTAILSPVAFTAQVASVDPAQALLNAYSSQITLEDDFLEILSEPFIFDSHFVERGRFGRLPSFMATWYKETGALSAGIGIDDHTALCIDQDMLGKVYGTGAVSFLYNLDTQQPYDTSVKMLRAKDMELILLLHGASMDLNNRTIQGLEDYVEPPLKEELGRYSLLFSGTAYPSDTAYDYFVNRKGTPADPVLIVCGSSLERANEVKPKLEGFGASRVNILQALGDPSDDPDIQSLIKDARKFFIIGNEYHGFMRFMNWTGAGALLLEGMKQARHTSFFAGDNARFAGKTVVENYLEFASSYRGSLEFLPGLGLLETSALMPNAFIHTDYYENTVSGLPCAMIKDALCYGYYLTGSTLAEYGISPENTSFIRNVAGSYPVISLEHPGSYTGFADQGPYQSSRNIVGFENMQLGFLGLSDSLILGSNVPLALPGESQFGPVKIYPTPADTYLKIEGLPGPFTVAIYDINGRMLIREAGHEALYLDLEILSDGLYLLNILDAEDLAIRNKQTLVISHGH